MTKFEQCLPLDDEDNKWDYCPSVPTALALFALFGLSTLVHFFQACRFRKGFCWVLIMGGLWETLSFAARLYSMHKPTESGPYDASFLLLIISPILINAFDYMVLGRMINFFLPQGTKVAGIKGSWVGKIFVCCDILSFIIQIGGGVLSLSNTVKTAKLGLHIYTFGVVFQQALILCFLALTIVFQQKLKSNYVGDEARRRAMSILHVLRASLILISYRIIFRIFEFAQPDGSSVYNYIEGHEWTVYAFDAIPMLLALILMNIFHPGPTSNMSFKSDYNYSSEQVPLEPPQFPYSHPTTIPFTQPPPQFGYAG